MKAEEYLERIKKLDAILENKIEQYVKWKGIAESMQGFSDSENVGGTRRLDKIPNAVAHYIDIDNEIKDLIGKRKAILQQIESLPTLEYQVIYAIYVNGLTFKEISAKIDKSKDMVKKLKQDALAKLDKLITPNYP